MQRRFAFVLLSVMVLLFSTSALVLAGDITIVGDEEHWSVDLFVENEGGNTLVNLFHGDDVHGQWHLSSGGSHVLELNANFLEDDYDYGFVRTLLNTSASYEDGGMIDYVVRQLDSKASYTDVPLESAWLVVSDGTGELVLCEKGTYAGWLMNAYNNPKTTNGGSAEATGAYQMLHQIKAPDEDFIAIGLSGDGSGKLYVMAETLKDTLLDMFSPSTAGHGTAWINKGTIAASTDEATFMWLAQSHESIYINPLDMTIDAGDDPAVWDLMIHGADLLLTNFGTEVE